MILNKYLAALLSIALVVVNLATAALQDGINTVEAFQLIPPTIAAILSFYVPLLNGKWAGGLKVGLPLLATLVTALIPYIAAGTILPQEASIVLFTLLQALSAQVGVDVRVEQKKLIDARETGVITGVVQTVGGVSYEGILPAGAARFGGSENATIKNSSLGQANE